MISRYTSLATVVLASLVFAACGFDESPEWAGSWKVIEPNSDEVRETSLYYEMSRDSVFNIMEDPDSENCTVFPYGISEVDGNIVTITPGKSETRNRYEVSGDTLKITFPDSPDRDEIIAKSVDGDPRDLAGCEQ